MVIPQPIIPIDKGNKVKTDLIYNLSKKIGLTSDLPALLEQITEMTQKALRASAASILLFRDNDQELYFEAASGPVGKELKSFKVDMGNSIAGQVIRTGKPLIVDDVKSNQNFQGKIDDGTGFVTKSILCVPLVTNQKTIGVLEVLNKLDGTEFDDSDIRVLVPVAVTAAMSIENTRLHQTILDAYKNTIITLVEFIDTKDPYTRGHSQRVMELTLAAASALSLSPEKMEILEYAGILHDIGKVIVDSRILNKPERLTAVEWDIMKEHPTIGANLLKNIPFLEKVSPLVRYHHERYDGSGYPAGLKGEDIPLGARLIAVADSFDTMTTNRPYREALTTEYAVNELKKGTGTQFCPTAVQAFLSAFTSQAKARMPLTEADKNPVTI